MNSDAGLVTKKKSIDELTDHLDFFATKNKLFIKSTNNPARIYKQIELALTKHIIDIRNKKHLFFENIALKYGGAHGFFVYRTSFITIKSCDISYIGGGYLRAEERYGNGIEFWGENTDAIIEHCTIDQIYDSGLTNQGKGTPSDQINIVYRNNRISNCGLASFEYFNSSNQAITNTIIFENNTSDNAGFGWAPPRKSYGGYHLLFHRNAAKTSNFIIRNNTFNKSRRSAIIFYRKNIWNGFEYMRFENNTYSITNKDNYLFRMFTEGVGWENYTFKERKKYSKKTLKDENSIFIISKNK